MANDQWARIGYNEALEMEMEMGWGKPGAAKKKRKAAVKIHNDRRHRLETGRVGRKAGGRRQVFGVKNAETLQMQLKGMRHIISLHSSVAAPNFSSESALETHI